MTLALRLIEKGLVPDFVIRHGIRRLLAQRLNEEDLGDPESQQAHLMSFLDSLRSSAIAIHTEAANEQHYEVPAAFFESVLGRHLKYSSAYFPAGVESLDDAEAEMLRLTVARAQLADGERILELGCGWGSLTLFMAQRFPNSVVTAVSNSRSQREFILQRARERRLDNIRVITCDVNALSFPADTQFDRVVSVEMFEHLRNYRELFNRIAAWLTLDGTLFVHIFTHKCFAYPFVVRDESDWMAKYFFTGGLMPAADTLLHFQRDLKIDEQWRLSGTHYEKTANAWLANHDRRQDEVLRVLRDAYGDNAQLWNQRWRMFWMACAELFGYDDGDEWMVGHYRFSRD